MLTCIICFWFCFACTDCSFVYQEFCLIEVTSNIECCKRDLKKETIIQHYALRFIKVLLASGLLLKCQAFFFNIFAFYESFGHFMQFLSRFIDVSFSVDDYFVTFKQRVSSGRKRSSNRPPPTPLLTSIMHR